VTRSDSPSSCQVDLHWTLDNCLYDPRPDGVARGPGGVGYEALQILCGDPVVDEVVATDVLAGVGQTRTNTARYQALQRGRNPNVEFETLDLLDVDATAALLEDVEPDVVLTAATLLRYSPFEELPDEQREKLIGFTSTGPGYACIVPGQIPSPTTCCERPRKPTFGNRPL